MNPPHRWSSSHLRRILLPERSNLFQSHWSNQWLTRFSYFGDTTLDGPSASTLNHVAPSGGTPGVQADESSPKLLWASDPPPSARKPPISRRRGSLGSVRAGRMGRSTLSRHHHYEADVAFVPTAEPAHAPALDAVAQGYRLEEAEEFGLDQH